MREWIRVSVVARCAYCGATLREGDPALAVKADIAPYHQKRPFLYCAGCKGPAPPDLAPAGPKQQRTKTMTSVFGVGATIRADLERRLKR